jgi:hypothetical protein
VRQFKILACAIHIRRLRQCKYDAVADKHVQFIYDGCVSVSMMRLQIIDGKEAKSIFEHVWHFDDVFVKSGIPWLRFEDGCVNSRFVHVQFIYDSCVIVSMMRLRMNDGRNANSNFEQV